MVWDKQHSALQRMSLEWLQDGTALGRDSGELEADREGNVTAAGR